MSNWHSMSIDEVVKELDTDPNKGLSAEEARNRLEKYGRNELTKLKSEKQKQGFGWSFSSVIITILLLAALTLILMDMVFGISIPSYFSE